jgi:Zn-dependent peptidase ImmA (M78 family)
MKMFRLNEAELLELAGSGLKNPLKTEDIFSQEIKLSHLKRVDKIFNKGLHYYLDPKAPNESKESSIFFRKESFTTDDLNNRAISVVNQFEELKLSLEAIAKLSDLEYNREFKTITTTTSPKKAATEIRKFLYPNFTNKRRDFLKLLIHKLAEFNILVFEFVEHPSRKEKANIDGFFLKPNFIVLKRHQAFRREIFTLAHELGHYLLNKEEIEQLELSHISNKNLSVIERWCNDFAFHFLAGEYVNELDKLNVANASNDYHFDKIRLISKNTHLSELALFTRMLLNNQISPKSYNNIKSDFEEQFRRKQEAIEKERQKLKEQGIKQRGSIAKPINSPLFISTIQTAFYEGIINEYEVSKRLKMKPEKIEQLIQ